MTTLWPTEENGLPELQGKLLIVDDDQPVLESLCGLLQASGFEVDAARGGAYCLPPDRERQL